MKANSSQNSADQNSSGQSNSKAARLMRQATGSDVARLAGVSKSAVSRAYTGGLVSDEARKRILEAARILKYRPNLTARSLTTSSSGLIGVALTHLDNQFYPDVVEHFSNRLRQRGYRLVLFITRGQRELDPVLDELLGYRLDGLVLASSSLAGQLAAECSEAGVPVVMFNNIDPEGRTPGIATDNRAGAESLARFLLAGDHRRFGIITGLAESSASVERSQAFMRVIVEAGLPEPIVLSGEYSFDGALHAARTLLQAPEPPEALFCINDHMAMAALQGARELGLEPGRDVSIVGFDNVAISAWPAFSLTTYEQPVDAMVERTVSRLLGMIEKTSHSNEVEHLPGRIVVRASARRPDGVRIDHEDQATWDDLIAQGT